MVMRIIRWIISIFTKHKRGVIAGAAGLGAAGAGAGLFNAHKAKKINRQALDIQQAALERHEQAYQETLAVLALLGEVEKDAIDSFEHFADTMERIQGRPRFKSSIFSTVKLPNYEPEEIKNLSAEVRMAIDGVVGAGVGGLAGLAAFGAGASALVAAPAMALGGVVLLTTKKRRFTKGNHTEFSIDLAIVFNNRNGCHRLIHEKTRVTAWGRYYWNSVPDSRNLFDKVAAIKDEHLWDEVIDEYLEKKNMYLRRQDYNHPSFNVYVETVNQVFNKYFD